MQAQRQQKLQQQHALQGSFRSLSAMEMPLTQQALPGGLSQGPLSLGDPYSVPGLSSPHDLPLMEGSFPVSQQDGTPFALPVSDVRVAGSICHNAATCVGMQNLRHCYMRKAMWHTR